MSDVKQSKALKIDQQILDKFWKLSESESSGIVKATDQLVVLLQKKEHHKNVENTDLSPELEYSVKRLVKGLASSRESARQGFSVALCQVLRKFDSVTVDAFLQLISKHLKLPKKESKSEEGSSYLGESLAYLVLIQSGRLFQDGGDIIKKVVKRLIWISERRVYLRQICYNGVCLIIKELDSEDFKQYVWPEISSMLQCGWEKCSPDVFSLLVTCRKHQSALVDKHFLKEHWKNKKLFKEENFPKIWNILINGAHFFPLLHNITKEVIQQLTLNDLSLSQFWQVGKDKVFNKSIISQLNLGFHVLLELLPLTKTAEELQQILTPDTVKTWVKNVDGNLKDLNALLPIAKSFGTKLIGIMKSTSDSELQSTIMRCVAQTPAFPGHETSKTVDLLVQQLNTEAAKDYGSYLMETFKANHTSSEEPKRVGLLSFTDMISHLRILVTLPSTATDHTWQLEILQFLALHSFWNVTEVSTDLKHCSHKCEDMSERLRKQCQDNFVRSLTQLLVFKTESSKTSSVHAYKNTVFQLVCYMQTLLEDKTTVVLVKPMSEEAEDDWSTMYTHLQAIHSQDDTSENSLNHVFELLFLYNAIQMFVDDKKDNSGLEDLIVCHRKATETKKKSASKKAKEEPAWIEVLTELLLSMMSQGSAYSRMVAKNVFACLTIHITPESLSMITEVLKAEKPGEDNDQIDIEDEDEEMEDIESDLDTEDKVEGEEENEESDSDEDTDSSESDGEVNDEFRKALKSALGPAAVEEGEEEDDDEDEVPEEEEPDLSDSEMFKLDNALSQVFKNMKKTKEKERKETQKQLNAFKLRVLDMVEAFIKSQPPADLILDLLFPLLNLMKHGERQKESRELSGRATSIFKMMYKRTKVHGSTDVGTEKYLESVKSTIEFSRKVIDKSLIQFASDACFIVIRLILNLEFDGVGPSPVKTRSRKVDKDKKTKAEKEQERLHMEVISILEESLMLYLSKRESKLNPAFFTNLFLKAPAACWPLTKTLVNVLKDKECKVFFKSQAVMLLTVLINKTTHDSIDADEWEEFSTSVIQSIENNIRETEQKDLKVKLLTEMVHVIIKLVPLSDNVKLSGDIVKKLEFNKKRLSAKCRRVLSSTLRKLNEQASSPSPQKRTVTDNTSDVPKKKKKNKSEKE